ncbi:unnamed protein product [Euphydryas editha]|uniref:Uncharacterized protein n=1 Tax=Euphydryas editha TaxID=104508 RepID=A0AAU9TDI8_EUPED|nr:unnamed protein product [Euphydryas editha]
MDGFMNSKIEKQTIYEIYRACRLCGAGAGYKMPIIQNVVHLDGAEVELIQKIRECVQIEVHQDDKMPPLICELCVDKVNDFYEFLEMCRQTNKRTRLRLGLPPQAMPRGAPDAGDCILGVTEPVFINEDSNEPTLRSRNKSSKSGKNNKSEKNIISSNSKRDSRDSRDSRTESRSLRSKQPSPPRLRRTKRNHDDDVFLSRMQKSRKIDQPKSILKKQPDIKSEDDSYLTPRMTRPRDREIQVKKEPQDKKVKLQIKPLPPRTLRNSSSSSNIKSKSPPPSHKCKSCKAEFNSYRALNNHMRAHTYAKQVEKKPVKKESKEIRCTDCRKTFPRKMLLNIHKCPKQGEVSISPKIRRMLKPLKVRVARCDPLLKNVTGEHYDVTDVAHDYGLDETCIYPYISSGLRIKSGPGYMVNINDDIRQAFDADKYVHWDSEDTDSDAETDASKKVVSLTSLSLKTIFSQKLLGKVPKKRRKVKAEKAFDSILNASEFDTELKRGINDIIDSLDDTVDESVDTVDESVDTVDESVDKSKADKSGDNDSLFGDEDAPTVTNDDFDSLFNKSNDQVSSESTAKSNDKDNMESNSNGENITENVINETPLKDISSENTEIELSKQENSDIITKEREDKISIESSIENIENTEIVNSLHDNTDILNQNEKDCNEKSQITKESESNGSDVTEKLNTEDSLIDKVENTEENTEENIQINTDSTSVIKEITVSENSENKDNDTITEMDNEIKDDTLINENVNECTTENINNDEIVKNEEDSTKDTKIDHVNGESEEKFNMGDLEDLSDGEMDDKSLMEALDAQIGENEIGEKQSECERDKISDKFKPSSIKSADLESISDDDFNLNE